MNLENPIQQTEKKLIEYLKGYMQEEINNRILELKYPRVPQDDMNTKIQHSMNNGSPQEKVITKMLIDRELAIMKRRQLTISNFLTHLNQTEYEILSQYYLKRKSWNEVAGAVNYSDRHCRRVRDALMRELTNQLAWDK